MTNTAAISTGPLTHRAQDGAEAARLIWDDDAAVDDIRDPRTLEFARAMIDTSVAILRDSRGLLKKMIGRAAAAAEDLAVAQFQGLVEVIQNADDVRATDVRLALRETKAGRQLLIVHSGQPVTCHNVLAMALPFLTTKTERRDQRGRFGIGLKNLEAHRHFSRHPFRTVSFFRGSAAFRLG